MIYPLTLRAVLVGAQMPTGPLSPPDPVEPDDEVDPDCCGGCGSDLDDGCPVDCPERALDDDADAWADR